MKILRVGDPHVKVTNLEEWKALMEFIVLTAIEHKVDRIELLGDLFHTHAVLRLEVLEFWNYWLDRLSDICEVVVLVGNHDQSGDFNSTSNSLRVFQRLNKPKLHIIESAKVLGPYGYIPYIHGNEKFIDIANGLIGSGAKILVCHQTFDGSKFESGMYAPDGIDPSKINAPIISGHIHNQQEFGKVWHPGTSRWDTASDANEIKGIWICTHDNEGQLIDRMLLKTNHVCSPIISVTVHEGEELPTLEEGARVSVELIGSSDWVSKIKSTLKGKCSIKTKITDKNKAESRKSGKSLEEFLLNHYNSSFVTKEKLLEYMKGLNLV